MASGMRAAAAALMFLWAAAAPASAHELSRSTSRITVNGRTVRVALSIGAMDLHQGPLVDVDGDGVASVEEVDAAIASIFAAIRHHVRLSADQTAPMSERLDRYGLSGGETLRLDLEYTFAEPVRSVTITATLPALTQPDHRHLVHAAFGETAQEAVLDSTTTQAAFAGVPTPLLATARRFVTLGIEHIVTGYDHLAFLVVLLIGASSLLDVMKIVTAFTVAHSVTLGLATFGVVTLPSALIESVIALSIAWVAVENLLRDRLERRWRVTFVFGLIHGFGFSNVLRDLELPRAALALSLFSFNAGVEIGQLAFVLFAFPLIWWALRRSWQSRLSLVGSSIVLMLGVYWFVQRLLLA